MFTMIKEAMQEDLEDAEIEERYAFPANTKWFRSPFDVFKSIEKMTDKAEAEE
jgi:hypothetical protein